MIWAIGIGVVFVLLVAFVIIRVTGAKPISRSDGMSDTSPSDMNSSL